MAAYGIVLRGPPMLKNSSSHHFLSLSSQLKELETRTESLKHFLKFPDKHAELSDIIQQLQTPSVWSDIQQQKRLERARVELQRVLKPLEKLNQDAEDCRLLLNLTIAENDAEALFSLEKDVKNLSVDVERAEKARMFDGDMDARSAYLEVTAGSGGTEAQDWVAMLLRMYLRWCESHTFNTEILQMSQGEVTGIKSVSVFVTGNYAFGWMRTESGVHRLVRHSPFDSGNRRHTSFAAVFVSPEIDDDIQIDIRSEDLRIDFYRASGAGGQHVNKTDSAVRITHLPSGAVSQCQSRRSQNRNREAAMKQLKAKLYELANLEKQKEKRKLENSKTTIGWGHQIRSYVLDQARVKDLRTKYESRDTQAVLDGDIDGFMSASLLQGV